MEHKAKNICKTVISSKEQILNLKKWLKFAIFILFQGLENQYNVGTLSLIARSLQEKFS